MTVTPDSPAQAFPALFALHGGPPPSASPTQGPELPASIPECPARSALADLVSITAAHPVQAWGKFQGEGVVLGLDAPEAWRAANAALWERALRLWRAALGVLAGPAWGMLPLGTGPAAGPPGALSPAGTQTPGSCPV